MDRLSTEFKSIKADYKTYKEKNGQYEHDVVSKCKDHDIKVVLVGEGSDELFGGYGIFKQALSNTSLPMEARLFLLYRQYIGRRYGSNYGEFRRLMKSYLGQFIE